MHINNVMVAILMTSFFGPAAGLETVAFALKFDLYMSSYFLKKFARDRFFVPFDID